MRPPAGYITCARYESVETNQLFKTTQLFKPAQLLTYNVYDIVFTPSVKISLFRGGWVEAGKARLPRWDERAVRKFFDE